MCEQPRLASEQDEIIEALLERLRVEPDHEGPIPRDSELEEAEQYILAIGPQSTTKVLVDSGAYVSCCPRKGPDVLDAYPLEKAACDLDLKSVTGEPIEHFGLEERRHDQRRQALHDHGLPRDELSQTSLVSA